MILFGVVKGSYHVAVCFAVFHPYSNLFNPVSANAQPFDVSFALRSSSGNRSPHLAVALRKLIFPRVFFSGVVWIAPWGMFSKGLQLQQVRRLIGPCSNPPPLPFRDKGVAGVELSGRARSGLHVLVYILIIIHDTIEIIIKQLI